MFGALVWTHEKKIQVILRIRRLMSRCPRTPSNLTFCILPKISKAAKRNFQAKWKQRQVFLPEYNSSFHPRYSKKNLDIKRIVQQENISDKNIKRTIVVNSHSSWKRHFLTLVGDICVKQVLLKSAQPICKISVKSV